MSNFTNSPYKPNQLTDLNGIGPKAADAVDDALEKYWRENPRKTKQGDEEESEGGDDEEAAEVPTEEDAVTTG